MYRDCAGISWLARSRAVTALHRTIVAGLAVVLALATLPAIAAFHSAAEQVIVRATGAGAAAAAVERFGGTVLRRLDVIDGVAARVPSRRVGALSRSRGVASVHPDVRMHALASDYDPNIDPTSVKSIVQDVASAPDFWNSGFDGAGVDVALIDTGVAPVPGLTTGVLHGPDLSFESQWDSIRHYDTYGHGTHIAAIISGRDDAVRSPIRRGEKNFAGVAPGARLLSLKVADATGAADVSQVIAAIDWVVQNRAKHGLNVRVLNLSFGTDATQSYTLDPLAYAAEVAWRKGIVVVTAAGNAGLSRTGLMNPATDPYVIAVGAYHDADGKYGSADGAVADWSARGDGVRDPDLVAPGKSIASLRVPGSYIDERNWSARVGDRYFRGSGTSQASAVVAGAAALLLQQRPSLTPDQVKAILTSSASAVPGSTRSTAGAGALDLKAAFKAATPSTTQAWPVSAGTGTLEGARGSWHVTNNNTQLSGEKDIFRKNWDGASWSAAMWTGASWSGGTWRGAEWTGASWSGGSWSGASWSGASWSGGSWSGASWSGASWSGGSWSGGSWSGASWSGASWSTAAWQ